ncbi:F-actin-monooxygenase MICAL3 isoform X4 [Pleurodeles waltl]|uniref:F-actin-monooxygenase MICAL3 isoform X4 n=1 Tax=Pleurodeles waltl TaxID=8319 RepID=UPI003709A24B
MDEARNEKVKQAHVLFDKFVQATTCKGTLKGFQELCDYLELKPRDYRSFYHKLKSKLSYWKAKALWTKLDKRGCHKDFKKGKACSNTKCLIIGAGPCGLRTAIDLSLLGAKVVVVEKRDAFSRNNVLHLWPFTINDLRGLGAKKFHGKFCAGAIDHISIRQLQLILLKVALILGIEIHVGVEFQGLIEPPEDQENRRIGWRAEVHPKTHTVSEYEFDVIIGADGRRNTLEGFRRKEFRGKLAIAITANFINRNTTAEAKVEEISGVAFIFNQKFFQDLREATGVDLENIVYYKDDTHYFVMTAKKQSLLEKGVILHDYADTELLLSRANVDQEALLSYAREAADFSTNQQLPSLDFAINHYGQPDVAMFDFTCMYASENAALVRERNGHRLLVALVGDSLLEPFWPMGTGIARGFLAAMDSAWMVRSWSLGANPLEVLAERESIYRLLPQTTPENVNKNFSQYSIDPSTRYPNISVHVLRPNQVRHLYNTNELKDFQVEMENLVNSRTPRLGRNESVARSSKLLGWCQKLTEGYAGVNVTDLTMSWKSGLALCAIIHKCRPDLIDFDSLDERCVEKTNQLAFDIAEKEFGISPIMTGKEMASVGEPDKLSMVMYLTQFYEMFKDSVSAGDNLDLNVEEKAALIASTKSPISFFSKLGQTISRKRTPKDKKEKESEGAGKRRKTSQSEDDEVPRSFREERPTLVSALTERRIDAAIGNQNKVKSMATQLLAKFEENAPAPNTGLRRQQTLLPYQERLLNQREQARLAPVPRWKQPRVKECSRTCPKKVILLSTFSSTLPYPIQQKSGGVPVSPLEIQQRACHLSALLKQRPMMHQSEAEPSRRFYLDQWQQSQSLRSSERPSSPSSDSSLRQKYIKMYTGGVSSLAEQIVNQLQRKDQPKPLRGKKELCSFRKEFPQNIGGSDVCYFCGKRVYVMERLSAEAKFFHRSCFKCDYCNATLRLSSYAYDLEDGKFYCKPHYCYRLSGYGQRKRPAAPSQLGKENKGPLKDPMATEETGRKITITASADRSPACNVNGVEDHSLAKRLRGTPERIELENYRVSLQREEELEEVPEETLAEHNLSSVLDQRTEQDAASSSSESEMEEEDEEEEDDEEGQPQAPSSDLGGVPWKEAVRIHALLKGEEEGNNEAEKAPESGVLVEENGEEDEEVEDEEDDESSEEGEYCPWDRELQQGLWLQHLSDEEDTGKFKAGNLKLQQAIQPVDPLEIQADVHWTHIRVKKEKEEENDERVSTEGSSSSKAPDHSSPRHEAVRAWLESVPGAPCEEEGAEDEVGTGNAEAEDTAGGDGNTCADLGDDDIPSDAEAEERLHHLEELKPDVEEGAAANVAGRKDPSKATDSVWLPNLEFNVLAPPGASFSIESTETSQDLKDVVSLAQFVKSPEERFFPEPFLPQDSHIADPEVKSPSALNSPIRSRLVSLEEATIPRPFTHQPFKSTPSSSTVASPTTTSPLASPVAISILSPTVSSNPLTPTAASRTLPLIVASSPVACPVDARPLAPHLVAASPLVSPADTSPLKAHVAASLFAPKEASPFASSVASSLLSPNASSPLSSPGITSPLASPAGTSPITSLDAISHVAPSISRSPLLPPVSTSPLASYVLTPSQPSSVDTTPQPSPVATGPVPGHWPVRSQPLPSTDLSAHTTDKFPVCLQPTAVITSTPLLKLAITSQVGEHDRLASPSAEEALKRNDLIEEFWMKSAEIRRSLGLTPVDRSKSFSITSVEVTPVRSNATPSVQDASVLEEHNVTSVRPRAASHRISAPQLVDEKISPLTPKSPSEKELRSSNGEKKDLSSSSGLGLNWSSCNTRTMASDSFNTSDSTMLTPPSSPPPPPPQNEEPATLRRKAPKGSLQNNFESKLSPASPPLALARKSSTDTRESAQLQREDLRKSFVESVDEIPFADDVEDTYDDRTEDSSFNEQFFTPPTSRPVRLHMPFPKENGESLDMNHQKKRLLPTVSLEAKELAEERMRAREKSVKSQALRDALALQLCKMKELELAAAATSAHVTASVSQTPSVKTSVGSIKTKELISDSPKPWVFKASEAPTLKHELANDRFLSPPAEGSVTSSDGSTGKSKKRASLFSPRKNKKEKKSKNDSSKLSDKLVPTPDEATKPRSLWKTVFSGYKKDKKKKQQLQQQPDDQSCHSTPSSSTTVDSGKAKASAVGKRSDLHLRRHLSFSEDSDLSSDDVLERSSQRSKRESVYVPHALAFKRSYSTKKAYTEEELSAKLTRRVQKAARRQAKQEELKRLHRAQIIQRQLEQVEEKQRQLEERGVAVEKALRGEADYWGESYYSDLIDVHLGGMGKKDDPKLMQEWFKLVQEKNALVRYESELMIFARELELEDRQSRLQQELRERMAVEDHLKTEKELTEEKKILNEMLDVVEQRDALVALLEEQRLQEKEEDKDLESVMLTKGFNLNWS